MITDATIQRLSPTLLSVTDRHGEIDYHKVCLTHRWVSLAYESRHAAERTACYACAAELDSAAGRRRFDEFQQALMPEPIIPTTGCVPEGVAK